MPANMRAKQVKFIKHHHQSHISRTISLNVGIVTECFRGVAILSGGCSRGRVELECRGIKNKHDVLSEGKLRKLSIKLLVLPTTLHITINKRNLHPICYYLRHIY